jgi:hypothetical protein
MTEALLALLLAAGPALQAPAQEPVVKRAAVATLEKVFDSQFERGAGMEVTGATRGIYLRGCGAVFATQVSLMVTPGLSMFRQSMTKEEIVRIHDRKVQQVPVLKQTMRQMLLNSAQALDSVPLKEEIVVGVSLFYWHWENTSGLPSQVLMRAVRGNLLQKNIAEGAITTEEF